MTLRADDRAVVLDIGSLALVSVGICLYAQSWPVMTVWVLAVMGIRMLLWARLPREQRTFSVGAELGFLFLCALIGGFNDWNTVVHHRVYSYSVPADLPAISTIPTWMLLYWGLILRTIATLGHWTRLGLPAKQTGLRSWGARRFGGRGARVVVLLLLTLTTRQTIYRLYLDPIWSWAPFAIAIVLYVWFLAPSRGELLLALLFLTLGPLVEGLYISVAHLHDYALGWILGVPLWIQLWWALAALVWAEISSLILGRLGRPTVVHAS